MTLMDMIVTPNRVTVNRNLIGYPSVGTATIVVTSSPYEDVVNFHIDEASLPEGWKGVATFDPASTLTPEPVVMSITASPECAYGEYALFIEADNFGLSEMIQRVIYVNVTPMSTHKLTLQATSGGYVAAHGSVIALPATFELTELDTLDLLAWPNTNNAFEKWTRDGVYVPGSGGDQNELVIQGLMSPTVVKAFFVTQYKIDVETTPGGAVTVPSSSPVFVPAGSSIHLTAAAQDGFHLSYWEIDGASRGNMLDWNYTPLRSCLIRAIFVSIPPTQRLLTIKVVGNGLTSPAANAHLFLAGTVTKVTAYPKPGSGATFIGWTLDDAPVIMEPLVNQLIITMDTNHTVIANFEGGIVPPEENTVMLIALLGVGLLGATVLLGGGK